MRPLEKDKKEIESFRSRTELLLGSKGVDALEKANVIVFGIGGVGGFTAEALVRAGVGNITLVDNDTVCESNRNRQIIALKSTVGHYKTEVMKKRLLDINPCCNVTVKTLFFGEETSGEFDWEKYDYIADAIDCVTSKILLAKTAEEKSIPIISSMGTGNKLDPTAFEVSDIYKTSVCPLAKAVRVELRKRGINHLKVVYSKELPVSPISDGEKTVPASISFVPSAMGLILAGEVIKEIALNNM